MVHFLGQAHEIAADLVGAIAVEDAADGVISALTFGHRREYPKALRGLKGKHVA